MLGGGAQANAFLQLQRLTFATGAVSASPVDGLSVTWPRQVYGRGKVRTCHFGGLELSGLHDRRVFQPRVPWGPRALENLVLAPLDHHLKCSVVGDHLGVVQVNRITVGSHRFLPFVSLQRLLD